MRQIISSIQNKAPQEKFFIQASDEFFESIETIVNLSVLKVLMNPERCIIFSVPWTDKEGKTQVNLGYRVQYSSSIGPYKGGIRFDPSVNLDIMKFLAFEQTFKNALTGLPLGGAKGGSDFDPKEKTDAEILNFCQSFMIELTKHIGPHTDVPAGDIGVGAKEIGYMFGQYKRMTQQFTGVFTGKDLSIGGSLARPEATGYGLIYIVQALLDDKLDQSIKGKKIVISGCGKVAIHAAYKAKELGARVVAMSDRSGYIFDEKGLNIKDIEHHKKSGKQLKDYTKANYVYELPIWSVPCDIALPCATQDELSLNDVKSLLINGCKIIAEGANRPLSKEAVKLVQSSQIFYLPGKAANAGGVAVSGLEMRQNAQLTKMTFESVDKELHLIMLTIYNNISKSAQKMGQKNNFLLGANACAYEVLEKAILLQGVL